MKGTGVVISVSGRATVRSEVNPIWQPLIPGQEISEGTDIKTFNKTLVRILNSDKTLTVIREEETIRYTAKSTREATADHGRNLDQFLREYFSAKDRRRMPSVRDLNAIQSVWMTFIALEKKSKSATTIETGFELMSVYNETGKENRVVAIATKLEQLFPNIRLNSLFERDLKINRLAQNRWKLYVAKDGVRRELPEDQRLIEGEEIQIFYQSAKESYFYQFLTSCSENGDVKTNLLYPSHISRKIKENETRHYQSKRVANNPLFLPSKNKTFILDDQKGIEYFWGWSCFGPVTDDKTLEIAISTIEKRLNNTCLLSHGEIITVTPGFCPASFFKKVIHH